MKLPDYKGKCAEAITNAYLDDMRIINHQTAAKSMESAADSLELYSRLIIEEAELLMKMTPKKPSKLEIEAGLKEN